MNIYKAFSPDFFDLIVVDESHRGSAAADSAWRKILEGRTLKHIVWDWNGTLLNDAWLCVEIINDLLKKQELPAMTHDYYQQEFGFPIRGYYQKIGFDFSSQPYEDLADSFITRYEERRRECKLQPGAREILEFVQSTGISQLVLSVYLQESLRTMIAHFSLTSYFLSVCGLKDHYAHTKVELGMEHVEALDLDLASTILVGDTIHDHEAAEAMGLHCLLIPSGHQNRSRLESTSAEVIGSLSDLKHLTSRCRERRKARRP